MPREAFNWSTKFEWTEFGWTEFEVASIQAGWNQAECLCKAKLAAHRLVRTALDLNGLMKSLFISRPRSECC
jgi:hypothetical protein